MGAHKVWRDVLGRFHRILTGRVSIPSHQILPLAAISDMVDDVIDGTFLCLTSITFFLPLLVVVYFTVSSGSFR